VDASRSSRCCSTAIRRCARSRRAASGDSLGGRGRGPGAPAGAREEVEVRAAAVQALLEQYAAGQESALRQPLALQADARRTQGCGSPRWRCCRCCVLRNGGASCGGCVRTRPERSPPRRPRSMLERTPGSPRRACGCDGGFRPWPPRLLVWKRGDSRARLAWSSRRGAAGRRDAAAGPRPGVLRPRGDGPEGARPRRARSSPIRSIGSRSRSRSRCSWTSSERSARSR